MFDVFLGGGFLMLPIFLCAGSSVYIIVKKLCYFSMIRKKDEALFVTTDSMMVQREFDQAIAACQSSGTPSALLVRKVLQFRNYPDDDIRDAAENEINRLLPVLDRMIAPLGTIAHISTLLGLLGTVVALIEALGILSGEITITTQPQLALALAHSLITTAAGLFVSIPSIVFHNYFVSYVDRCLTKMESIVTDLMIRLSGRDKLL